MQVLSIQSAVAYGHVGNSAAVFPLQRLGHEVIAVNTVNFSNHTGYGAWRGPVISAEDVHEVILGIEERGALAGVDLILSGYLGTPAMVDVVQDAVARTRRANPAASYTCDPVIGNAHTGLYVEPAIPSLLADRLVPLADLITPNQFELARLTGTDDVLAGARAALDLGPSTVLVTSVEDAADPDRLGMVVVTPDAAWQVSTPRLPGKVAGSGDVTAALFSAHLGASGDPADSLARTAASVHTLLEATIDAGSPELLLVECQESYAAPANLIAVDQIA